MDNFYRYSKYLKEKFGGPTYKISLDAKFSCPNRDGSKLKGGCIYCNETSFSPSRNEKNINKEIDERINSRIDFLNKRHKNIAGFLGYLQPNTNTYADIDTLYKLYKSILDREDISGLIIGTRPDCVDEEIIDMIDELAQKKYVSLEYGLQTKHNESLKFINRGETVDDFIRAMEITQNRNIDIGIHLILGLPYETEEQMLETVKFINNYNYKIVKYHNLHITTDTLLEKIYRDRKNSDREIEILSLEKYTEILSKSLELTRKDAVIGRLMGDGPAKYLLKPKWSLDKNKSLNYMYKYFKQNNIVQGSKYVTK